MRLSRQRSDLLFLLRHGLKPEDGLPLKALLAHPISLEHEEAQLPVLLEEEAARSVLALESERLTLIAIVFFIIPYLYLLL